MAALAAKRLDRTLTTALPDCSPTDEAAIGPTTVATFDAVLGGFPRGQLSELVGPQSSGRTSLLLRLLAAATARGELVALVDALDHFDPESAAVAGIDLERLLWIRGTVVPDPRACRDANQRALEQAVKALSLVLQAGNFGLVAFDVADAPADALGRLPFTTWLRVQRMVEGSQTQCVLMAHQPIARSAAGLTVTLKKRDEGRPEAGRTPPWRFDARLFDGLNLEARVIRARARRHEDLTIALSTTVTYRG